VAEPQHVIGHFPAQRRIPIGPEEERA
jgi:hypothetical protein